MKNHKCKTCGKEHALGGCPEFKSHIVHPADAQFWIEINEKPALVDLYPLKPKNIGLMQSVSKDTLKVVPSLAKGDNKRDEAGATPALLEVATGNLPKPKMGRPRTGYIKAEYNRKYSADKRAADKLGVSVREYRASKACAV